jgi:hypothetical protein
VAEYEHTATVRGGLVENDLGSTVRRGTSEGCATRSPLARPGRGRGGRDGAG